MRAIYLTFFLLALAGRGLAQQGLAVGVNVGAVNSYMVDNKRYGDVNYSPQTTIHPLIGAAATDLVNDHWGFGIEYNYTTLGQKYKQQDSSMSNNNGEIALHYHQFPVMIAFSGGDYKSRFLAMFGPQFSYLYSASHYHESNQKTDDISTSFSHGDVGLLAVAGGNVTVKGNFYVCIALRFYYGLKTINTNTNIIYEAKDKPDYLENSYAGATVGLHYIFRNQGAARE